MFVVEWVQTRPSTDVPWSSGSDSMRQLNSIRQEFSGFIGKEVIFSSDRLTRTTLTKWVDEASAQEFSNEHRSLVDEVNLLTMLYNQENNIAFTRTNRS